MDLLESEIAARYERQVLLPHVGVEGQRRIMAARASVAGDSLAQRVAALYLERAGVQHVGPGPVDASVDSELVTVPAAREVLAGSLAAVRVLRAAVGVADGSGERG